MRADLKESVKELPLNEQVYGKMIERLKNGSWEPGKFFDRRSLAKELGVSIAPVGDAMVRLEQEGFIESMPRKGTRVRSSDPRRLYECLIMREAIEAQAARLILGGRLAKEEKTFAKLADLTEGKRGHTKMERDADAEFHGKLVACAGIGELARQHSRLLLHILFDEIHLLVGLTQASNSPDSHRQLLKDLIEARSPEVAEARIRKHLRNGKESFYKRFEQEG